MEEYRDQVSEVFQKHDTDGNGLLSQPDILKVTKELGKNISNYEAKRIFKKLDTNKDQKLSLDEFLEWWYWGHIKGVQDLLFFSCQATKALNKFDKGLEKIGGLETIEQQENSEHIVGINIGEQPPKSYLGGKVLIGQEAKQHSDELCQGFENISVNDPSILIKIKTKDSEAAKEQFQDLFEQAMALAESILPPEFADQIIEKIKLDYSNPDPNYVIIGISFEEEIISRVIDQFLTLIDKYLPQGSLASLNFTATTGFNLKDLVDQQGTNFEEQLAKAGINIKAELNINKTYMKAINQKYIGIIEKMIEKNKKIKEQDRISILLLSFLQSTKVLLNFKTFDDVISELDLPLPSGGPSNLSQAIQLLKEETGDPKESISEIPIAEEAIQLFKDHCQSDIQITVSVPQGAVVINAVTEGFSDISNLILEE